MSDKTSAGIYSMIFVELAKEPITEKDLEYAKTFWNDSYSYDFHPCQLLCNQELLSLKLARAKKIPKEDRWSDCECSKEEFCDCCAEFEYLRMDYEDS